jgi:hypothetical protein
MHSRQAGAVGNEAVVSAKVDFKKVIAIEEILAKKLSFRSKKQAI